MLEAAAELQNGLADLEELDFWKCHLRVKNQTGARVRGRVQHEENRRHKVPFVGRALRKYRHYPEAGVECNVGSEDVIGIFIGKSQASGSCRVDHVQDKNSDNQVVTKTFPHFGKKQKE